MRAGIYKHYKGGYYQVLGIAEDSDNSRKYFVIYISLTGIEQEGLRFRCRSLDSWNEPVELPEVAGEPKQFEARYHYIGI
jgi:hypothetical protein